MAKTLLESVNAIFKRCALTSGDAGDLSTLTDSARQHWIDVAVQVVNEGLVHLYAASSKPMPKEQGESTITLVAGTRAYALAADLVQINWPMVDKTNAQFIAEYPGGYNRMLTDDPEQDDTGLPIAAAIRSTDGLLHLDRAPTSAEAGRIYTYQYDKSLLMATAASTVPFSDSVWTLMVPVWAQLWNRNNRREFDDGKFKADLGLASGLLTQSQARTSYNPRG